MNLQCLHRSNGLSVYSVHRPSKEYLSKYPTRYVACTLSENEDVEIIMTNSFPKVSTGFIFTLAHKLPTFLGHDEEVNEKVKSIVHYNHMDRLYSEIMPCINESMSDLIMLDIYQNPAAISSPSFVETTQLVLNYHQLLKLKMHAMIPRVTSVMDFIDKILKYCPKAYYPSEIDKDSFSDTSFSVIVNYDIINPSTPSKCYDVELIIFKKLDTASKISIYNNMGIHAKILKECDKYIVNNDILTLSKKDFMKLNMYLPAYYLLP